MGAQFPDHRAPTLRELQAASKASTDVGTSWRGHGGRAASLPGRNHPKTGPRPAGDPAGVSNEASPGR